MNDSNQTAEAIEQIGSTLSAIVPQLFFDLIARLIPGLAIIWSLYLALLSNSFIDSNVLLAKISNLLPQITFFLFCITIVIFYVTSIVFYGLWSFLVHILPNRIKYKVFIEVLESSEEFSLRHDFIKLRAPIAGNRIAKLKAEIHMSGALTASFTLCFLISIVGYFIESTLSNSELISRTMFFFIGAIGFFYSNRHFSRRLFCSVCSYSALLDYDKKKYSFPTVAPSKKLATEMTLN